MRKEAKRRERVRDRGGHKVSSARCTTTQPSQNNQDHEEKTPSHQDFSGQPHLVHVEDGTVVVRQRNVDGSPLRIQRETVGGDTVGRVEPELLRLNHAAGDVIHSEVDPVQPGLVGGPTNRD